LNGRYNIGDIVLGNWVLKNMIGEGSFGRVYEAERVDFNTVYRAAIKIITIPHSQAEIESARAEGMSDESVTAYFSGFVEEVVREFALMSRLDGTANVVSYKDHIVVAHTESVGWDIIIRMELLTPLLNYTSENHFIRQDVIKLGVDVCRALELCQKFNIIHRDIKPENIFISELGDFKLGDFGIARTVEKTMNALSKKGTYSYMAPEVYRGEEYGSSIDTYSLGIVLYRMLNDNRGPFLPNYPEQITYNSREAALAKRISGAKIPLPRNADERLAEIVLKACAFDPKDRYSGPTFMRRELEAILYNRDEAPIIYPHYDEAAIYSTEGTEPLAPPQHRTANTESTVSLFNETAVSDPDEGDIHADSLVKELFTEGEVTINPEIEATINLEDNKNAVDLSNKNLSDKLLAGMIGNAEVPLDTIELSLSHNRIRDLEPLDVLKDITMLDISGNQIDDILPLMALEKLTVLNLERNQIDDISPLDMLYGLICLYMWDNLISDISPLQDLTNLTTLGLDMNQISDISPLQSLTNLTALDLRNNKISDISPLMGLKKLETLSLEGNPITLEQIQELEAALPNCIIDY